MSVAAAEHRPPSGPRARVAANLDALEVLRRLEAEGRPAEPDERLALARWSSWGAVPAIFDEQREEWAAEREQLHVLLDEPAYAAARRTTVNAHYTDPAYVAAIWQALDELGVREGRVFEPGVGAGTFIGSAPAGVEMVGVELDPTTARIARALYPDATILTESIADTRLAPGTFDAAVGNVPFADVRLYDPQYNRGGHSLHNHCILKALAFTRPGGIVAVLTSRYTLDAQNPAARREMSAMADLIGAVRLPAGAHRRTAGTNVVTDLVILRRREPDVAPVDPGWEMTVAIDVDGETHRINAYFAERPDRVLGTLTVDDAMYGGELSVRARDERPVHVDLAAVLGEIVGEAREAGQVFGPVPAPVPVAAALAPAEGLWDGHLLAEKDGQFSVVQSGAAEPLDVPASQRQELRALLGLRDRARVLLTAEAASLHDTPEIDRLRVELADAYRGYHERYGPINRFSLRRTGRTDPTTGEQTTARIVPRVMHTLRGDPFAPLIGALENFDASTQTATPAALMTQRTIVPREPVLGVSTADEALAVSLEVHGRVDLEHIAQLLGTTTPDARHALGELVFDDPAEGRLVAAAEYLSGNVRAKLDIARGAAGERPALEVNVRALQDVLPEDLGMDDVTARLGAVWIDAETHQQFLREILDDPALVVDHPGGAIWAVQGDNHSLAAVTEWGTARVPAPKLAKAVLEQRPVQVTDEIDGRRVVNPTETAAAVEKAEAMQERFGEWVWEDPDRGARLLAEYNRRFNSIVLRDYTLEGQRLTLPGLARTFAPRPHQRAAVARMLNEPAVGLFHEVGAGKTAEMVMGTMELRRLGMVAKPAVVVPNHMLEQFTREWLQLYPQARLLAATREDLAGDRRRAFVARVATNDWDAVLLTRSAFERLPVSPETEAAYLQSNIAELRDMLTATQDGHGLTVKRIEKQVMRREEQVKKLRDHTVDPGVTFELTGIDYLVVDELHDYKNLHTESSIRDAAIDGSQRASDLHTKIEYLRGRHGDRVICGATATPIANSVTEAHVMQRYLRPDLLQQAGVLSFDAWAATFGRTTTELEMAPAGGYRLQTRFAQFQNVPEMLRMWHVFADVRTAEDLDLPTPALRPRSDGQRLPETVLVPASPQMAAYVSALGDRADAVRSRSVTPDEDNMLKISGDGRKAALDLRLVTDQPPEEPGKLDIAAATIAGIWQQHRDHTYLDPATDQPSPTPGALQIVFCDLATPRAEWNAYDELRDQLTHRGMPREQIRFIHEAKTDADKARLFAAARSGHVAVLIGSTQKMGVGTNVQARAVALHHIDCPWRPADIAQRDGRIIRQGNQNPEVGIYRYVVEGSFDAYSWQTVERKARFIAQIMRGRLDVREIDDVGDNALSFAEVKALASGDPLILDKAAADADVTKLERLHRAWQRNRGALTYTISTNQTRLQRLDSDIPAVQTAAARTIDTRGDRFAMTIDGRHVSDRPTAADHLRRWAQRNQTRLPYGRSEQPLGPVAELGGHTIDATLRRSAGPAPHLELHLTALPAKPASLPLDAIDRDAASLIRQLEHRVADLPALADRLTTEHHSLQAEITKAHDGLQRPFKHTAALTDARARLADITAQMTAQQDTAQHDSVDTDPTELDELRRMHAAHFPAGPQPRSPVNAPTAERPAAHPQPATDLER